MTENLVISKNDKVEKYQVLLPQIEALVCHESNWIANLANVCAALNMTFDWLWVGFYIVRDEQLVLGPFQGPLACSRIQYGKGVCGVALQTELTQVVPNVEEFAGHIACSSLAKSEIVVPIHNPARKVIGVLDVDSSEYAAFDEIDQHYLEQLIDILQRTKFSAELAVYCDVFP